MKTYGRRNTSKRTMRKRGTRRLRRNYRISRSPFQAVGYIKRKFWFANWVPSTASTADFWKQMTFNLTNMYNSSEITALYDQYRIAGIKVELHPRYSEFSGNDTVDTTLPGITNQGGTQVHVINDPYNEKSLSGVYNVATLNYFLEQGNVRSYSGNKKISFYIKPTVYQTIGGFSTGKRIRAPFLSTQTASTSIHYGADVFMADVNLTGAFGQSFDVFLTYHLQVRGLK